jgi:hypothetical protein
MSEILKNVARMLDAQPDVVVVPGWEVMGDKVHFGVRTTGVDFISAVAVCTPPMFQIRTTMMGKATNPANRPLLMKAILDLNFRLKFAKFAFDPDDGEFVAYLDLIVGPNGPTQRQLSRCVQFIQRAVNGGKLRLEKLDSTGIDPGMQNVRAGSVPSPEELIRALERLRDGIEPGGGGNGVAEKKPEKKPDPFTNVVRGVGLSDDEIFGKSN